MAQRMAQCELKAGTRSAPGAMPKRCLATGPKEKTPWAQAGYALPPLSALCPPLTVPAAACATNEGHGASRRGSTNAPPHQLLQHPQMDALHLCPVAQPGTQYLGHAHDMARMQRILVAVDLVCSAIALGHPPMRPISRMLSMLYEEK